AMGCEGIYEKIEYMGEERFRPCRVRKSNEFSSVEHQFKLDDEKRMIYAPAMIPNKLIRRYEPGEGEYFVRFSKEAIERGAHKFLMEGRTSPEFVNYEHTDKKFDDIYLVESWIVGDSGDKIYDYGYSQEDVPSGSWVVGYKVDNDELWNDYVKKGLIKAVSVEGLFDMSFSKEKSDEYLLNEVINIITQIN
ncbi:MAG: XkdF-like putative serine protease domain-containing protein, partial [Rhodoluna sp.]